MAEIWATESLHTCCSNVCLWRVANKWKVGLKTGWRLRGGAKAACFKLRHSYGGPVQDINLFESDSGRWYGTDSTSTRGTKKSLFLANSAAGRRWAPPSRKVWPAERPDLFSQHTAVTHWSWIGSRSHQLLESDSIQVPVHTFLHLVAYLGCFKFSDVNFRLRFHCVKRKCGT